MINKRFNRFEGSVDNMYFPNYGTAFDISYETEGYIKCKLLHSEKDSIILPDQIFIKTDGDTFIWFQPLTFLMNLLIKNEDLVECMFLVDISSGNTLKIEFYNVDLIKTYSDNSSLFKCKIYGPKGIHDYYTGTGYFVDNVPYLRLYHHTTETSKKAIFKNKELFGSKWNIQGTKKLVNISYFYLTSLDSIKKNQDLVQIAMASNGKISLIKDNFYLPPLINPKDKYKYNDGILEINVYRENTYNRKSTIEFDVDATLLAPKHLFKHYPTGEAVFYEYCMPYIQRIGIDIGKTIGFNDFCIKPQKNILTLDYLVIGDAREFVGLEAPFDEENTKQIFKVEKIDNSINLLDFWFENSNTDLFSEKNITFQEFE